MLVWPGKGVISALWANKHTTVQFFSKFEAICMISATWSSYRCIYNVKGIVGRILFKAVRFVPDICKRCPSA